MALDDIFRVDFSFQHDDRRVSVSHYYSELIIRTGTQEQVSEAIALAAEDFFWTDWVKLLSSQQLVYAETRVQQVFPTRQAPFISEVLKDEAGSKLVAAMNGTTAVLVSQYGIDWDRHFQGRMYVPGYPEDDADSGRMLTTEHGVYQAAADVFFNSDISPGAPAGGTYTSVVYSPTLAKADPLVLPVFSLIGATPVRPRIATQRRRRTNIQATA